MKKKLMKIIRRGAIVLTLLFVGYFVARFGYRKLYYVQFQHGNITVEVRSELITSERDKEFILNQIAHSSRLIHRYLGTSENDDEIDITICKDAWELVFFSGLPIPNAAPFREKAHTYLFDNSGNKYCAVLIHEMVHILDYKLHPDGKRPNSFMLMECLAGVVDPESRSILHPLAHKHIREGTAYSLQESLNVSTAEALVSTFCYDTDPLRPSNIILCSFVKYLIDAQGKDKFFEFWRLTCDADWRSYEEMLRAVYGKGLPELEGEWQTFLKRYGRYDELKAADTGLPAEDMRGAIRILTELAAIDPEDPAILSDLGYCYWQEYIRHQNAPDSADLLRQAFLYCSAADARDMNYSTKLGVAWMLGLANDLRGDRAAAVECYQRVIASRVVDAFSKDAERFIDRPYSVNHAGAEGQDQ